MSKNPENSVNKGKPKYELKTIVFEEEKIFWSMSKAEFQITECYSIYCAIFSLLSHCV